ncbi:MAG TPA: TolC family protein [Terriglobia bacterium]|nr:TolC family protein [Terriglobia bacterium]
MKSAWCVSAKKACVLVAVGLIWSSLRLSAQGVPASRPEPRAVGSETPDSALPPLALSDLEKMALAHNPTLAESQADARASAGRRLQSGLYPNPVIGYEGREITGGAVYRGGEHGFFVQQPIVTAGKLRLSRKVFATEEEQAKSVAAAQQARVINAVRMAYYQALAAQQELDLRANLAGLAEQARDVSNKLANVGQADQPDVLEARVEAGRAGLDLLAARADQDRAWQELASVVGDPALTMRPLAGKLDDGLPQLDRSKALDAILAGSPEVQAASQDVKRAEAAAKRARAEKFPDIDLRAGVDYNFELLGSMGQPVGWEGEASVGIQIPIFNRNQGNIQTAEAELAHAQQELERVKLALRMQFASVFRNYANADEAARRYRGQILPDAEKAYQLYLGKYREMATAYPQVLIAQRTLFQLREDYTRALVSEWESAIAIQGYLLSDGLAAPIAPGEPGIVSPGVEVRASGLP